MRNNPAVPIQEWLKITEKIFENEFEYLPIYTIGITRYPVVWRVDMPRYPTRFLHNPDLIKKIIYQPILAEERLSQSRALGYYLYALIHDFVHLYQAEILAKNSCLNTFSNPITRYYIPRRYRNWIEGLAELYTFQILHNLYTNAENEKPHRFKNLTEKTIGNFLSELLVQKQYKSSLRIQISYHLAQTIQELWCAQEISELSLGALNLPFIPHTEIVATTQDILSKKNLSRRLPSIIPYSRGAYYLTKRIKKEGATLHDLLITPLPNTKLGGYWTYPRKIRWNR